MVEPKELTDLASRGFSRRSLLDLAGSGLLLGAVGACSPIQTSSGPQERPASSHQPSATPTPIPPTPVPEPSLEEKIGQMIMLGFTGFHVDDTNPIAAAIESKRLGNVVLFDSPSPGSPSRNIDSPVQLSMLDRQLKAMAPSTMLIAVDEEGGQVARLAPNHGFPPTVSAQYLGRLNWPSPDLTDTFLRPRKRDSHPLL